MAERRMISKKVVDTDTFIDMPISARLLYYELLIRADDDGFVASPKKIIRMAGCSDDDMKLLICKSFVIPFDTGVCVVVHWRVHNYIRPDRYTQTIYRQEKQMLTLDSGGAYQYAQTPHDIPPVIPDDIPMVCHRLGKDRLGKSKDNTLLSSGDDETAPEQPDFQAVIDMFNAICVDLPKVVKLTPPRRAAIKARLHELGGEPEELRSFFESVHASDFLCGRGKDWRASFDWIMKPANFVKIVEGNYANSALPTLQPDFYDTSRYNEPPSAPASTDNRFYN